MHVSKLMVASFAPVSVLYLTFMRTNDWEKLNLILERRLPPEFTVPPDPVYEVMLGADLNITCVAVGSPMPSVKYGNFFIIIFI